MMPLVVYHDADAAPRRWLLSLKYMLRHSNKRRNATTGGCGMMTTRHAPAPQQPQPTLCHVIMRLYVVMVNVKTTINAMRIRIPAARSRTRRSRVHRYQP